MNKDRRWYVVQSKLHHEDRVLDQLERQAGFECYFPRIEVYISKGGRRLKVIRPLFPRYLFVRLILPEEWKLVTYTRGVSTILGSWREPAFVPDEVIEAIRERESQKDRLINYYQFQPEEAVRVRSGPLRDLYGIFDRYVDDAGRVRVLLNFIGYQAPVEMEAEHLERS